MALKKRAKGGGKASRADFGAKSRFPLLYCFACEPPFGTKAEFEALIGAHRDALVKLAFHMLGDPEDAKDAVQDALLKAWRAWPRFRGQSSARTWIFRILSNHILDLLRRPRPTESLDSLHGDWREGEPVEMEDHRPRLDHIASLHVDLQRALDALAPRDRLMLELDALGFSSREIAKIITGVSHALVCRSIEKSRAKLRTLLPVVDPAEAVAIAEAASTNVSPTNEPTALEVVHEELRRD